MPTGVIPLPIRSEGSDDCGRRHQDRYDMICMEREKSYGWIYGWMTIDEETAVSGW